MLKPGGRLVIADFKGEGRREQSAPFGSVRDLPGLVGEAGFAQVKVEEMPFPMFSDGVVFVSARKG